MKRLIPGLLVLILTILFGPDISAQSATQPPSDTTRQIDYVVLTRKVLQLKPILLAAEQFRQEDGAAFGDFAIIVCGADVASLTDPTAINPFREQARALGARIVACGFSLNKFGVDRAAIPEDIEIVENGIQYSLSLQKQGYYSLSL